ELMLSKERKDFINEPLRISLANYDKVTSNCKYLFECTMSDFQKEGSLKQMLDAIDLRFNGSFVRLDFLKRIATSRLQVRTMDLTQDKNESSSSTSLCF